MRIAFVSHSRCKVGGAESYLDSVIPAFSRAGHDVAGLFEDDRTLPGHDWIWFPDSAPTWSVQGLGREQAATALKRWHPDICFVHGLRDSALEAAVITSGPSALYIHNYYGTCISGNKTHSTATPEICERRFGTGCLLQYFPRRCGGNNPLTMIEGFQLQSKRLELMRRYQAIIANSQHMAREIARHDLKAECLPCPAVPSPEVQAQPLELGAELRLIFAGRMTQLKGGQYFLETLPKVQRRLNKKLFVSFAGDGPDRLTWESKANEIRSSGLAIEFTGWLDSAALRKKTASSHLLVFPSIWPEPFGLSGLEAGLLGVPTAAFAVGGIPEWLHDGVNGHLATVGVSPLADAIVRCLDDSNHYHELRAGACRRAREYSLEAHISQLVRIFERCV